MDFFLFWVFIFHFIAFGLSPSSLGYDGFLLFLDLGLIFLFYCFWFKFVGFRLWCFICCFMIWGFFFHFIACGLSPSGLGYDGFYSFFDLRLLFPFYCLWFKSVGFRLWCFFFCFLIWGFFFYFIAFGLCSSGLGYDVLFVVLWFGAFFPILLPAV